MRLPVGALSTTGCVRSRLPYGSRQLAGAHCRSALTGPGGDAGTPPEKREWQALSWQTEAEQVAVEAHTVRRILLRSMRSQPAPLVRGSSRRIMTVRFRPANIRVINRRLRGLNCHLFGFPNKRAGSWTVHPRAGPISSQNPSGLDRSLHIRTYAAGCSRSSPAGRAFRPVPRAPPGVIAEGASYGRSPASTASASCRTAGSRTATLISRRISAGRCLRSASRSSRRC